MTIRDYILQIERYIFLGGCFISAIICIVFFYGLVEYIFYRGDDARRAHAKLILINTTITLFLFLIVWGIASLLAGAVT